MTTLTLKITLEYDEDLMHGDDESSREWFRSSILQADHLVLHSNEIGDEVGTIKAVSILPNDQEEEKR